MNIEKILASDNLAEDLSEEQLKDIEQTLTSGIKADEESRKGWEQDVEEWINLATQVRDTKSFPWQDASNVKYPILTIASMQFAARAYPALLSGPNLVHPKVNGYDQDGSKAKKASRVGKHMSYQVRNQMGRWEPDMDRLLHSLSLVGTQFKKIYFDPLLQRNVAELVGAQELLVNYFASSLEDAERKTHILYYTKNQVRERITSGLFVEPEKELTPFKDKKKKINPDKTQNMRATEDDSIVELFESHCFLDLDGDGYAEPYIVTLHRDTMQVLRIAPRFKAESITYNKKEDIIRIAPKEYFVSYIFIPDPNSGVYGLGFGSLLGPLNNAINTLVNQLIDAGTLSVLQGGFLSSNLQLQAGDLEWDPGEWKIVNSYGSDIRQGIVPLPAPPPSSTLFNLLGMLETASMKIASVTDILTGEVPGQNTKATVSNNAIEQGLTLFSSIYKRQHFSLSNEMMMIHDLNAEFLEEEEYLAILDKEEDGGQKITREDYNTKDYDLNLSADPNVSSDQQRLSKVQALFEAMNLGHVNPAEVTKQYLEATDQPNIEGLMTMPEPGPPPIELQVLQAESEHKIAKEQWETKHREKMETWDREIASYRIDLEALKINAQAILDLAKAEGEEEGRQLGEMRNYLDQIRSETEQVRKNKKDAMDARQKEEENAIAREQLAAQQQQAQKQPPQ